MKHFYKFNYNLTKRVVYFLAAKVRILFFFKFLRMIYSRHGTSLMVKKFVGLLDPNNIRRTSKAKIRPLKVIIKGKNGESMALNLNEHIDFVYFMNFTFDNTCFELMKAIGRGSAKVFVDVGANIGTVSIPVSLYNPVIAFEPIYSTFLQLMENSNLNYPENVEIVNSAIASPAMCSRSNTIKLFQHYGNSGTTSLREDWNPGAGDCEIHTVPIVTLDDGVLPFLKGERSIALVKIDVEGQELSVLEGAREIIQMHRPFFVLEWRPDRLGKESSESLAHFFYKMSNYSVFGLRSNTKNYRITLLPFEENKIWENILLVPKEKAGCLSDMAY